MLAPRGAPRGGYCRYAMGPAPARRAGAATGITRAKRISIYWVEGPDPIASYLRGLGTFRLRASSVFSWVVLASATDGVAGSYAKYQRLRVRDCVARPVGGLGLRGNKNGR